MTRLTILTPQQVCAVLLGLVDHRSGTETDHHRRAAVEAMADALTAPTPVTVPELEQLRQRLVHALSRVDVDASNLDPDIDDRIVDGVNALDRAVVRFRARLVAVLGLDDFASDLQIADAVAVATEQRATEWYLQRLASAGQRIDAVRQLHRSLPLGHLVDEPVSPDGKYCSTCNAEAANAGTPEPWPCPTIRVRDGMCGDCAYRPGSPEKAGHPAYRGDADELESLAAGGTPFYCHDGLRRVLRQVHPAGVQVPADPGAYDPPIIDGLPFRADGQPALLCAGWAARGRALAARQEVDR